MLSRSAHPPAGRSVRGLHERLCPRRAVCPCRASPASNFFERPLPQCRQDPGPAVASPAVASVPVRGAAFARGVRAVHNWGALALFLFLFLLLLLVPFLLGRAVVGVPGFVRLLFPHGLAGVPASQAPGPLFTGKVGRRAEVLLPAGQAPAHSLSAEFAVPGGRSLLGPRLALLGPRLPSWLVFLFAGFAALLLWLAAPPLLPLLAPIPGLAPLAAVFVLLPGLALLAASGALVLSGLLGLVVAVLAAASALAQLQEGSLPERVHGRRLGRLCRTRAQLGARPRAPASGLPSPPLAPAPARERAVPQEPCRSQGLPQRPRQPRQPPPHAPRRLGCWRTPRRCWTTTALKPALPSPGKSRFAYICIHVYLHVFMYMYIYIYVYMYLLYMYICICVYVYVSVNLYL